MFALSVSPIFTGSLLVTAYPDLPVQEVAGDVHPRHGLSANHRAQPWDGAAGGIPGVKGQQSPGICVVQNFWKVPKQHTGYNIREQWITHPQFKILQRLFSFDRRQ